MMKLTGAARLDLAATSDQRPEGARLAGLGFSLPNSRVSAAMKYRQDNNAMMLSTKIYAVWKTMCDDTPNVFTNNSKLEWV
jgi:hypothetical protein